MYDLHEKRFTHEPQLSYRRGTGGYAHEHLESRDYWCLTSGFPHNRDEDKTYGLIITHAWDGEAWDHYRFAEWEMGTPVELVTKAQFEDRVQAIADHEGDEEATKWKLEQTEWRVITRAEAILQAALQRRWEAVRELVGVSVTL